MGSFVCLPCTIAIFILLFAPKDFVLTLNAFRVALCSVSWTPSFLLKRYVLTGIRDGPHEPFIADSVDFAVSQVMIT